MVRIDGALVTGWRCQTVPIVVKEGCEMVLSLDEWIEFNMSSGAFSTHAIETRALIMQYSFGSENQKREASGLLAGLYEEYYLTAYLNEILMPKLYAKIRFAFNTIGYPWVEERLVS